MSLKMVQVGVLDKKVSITSTCEYEGDAYADALWLAYGDAGSCNAAVRLWPDGDSFDPKNDADFERLQAIIKSRIGGA